jgi:death-on-curing protein
MGRTAGGYLLLSVASVELIHSRVLYPGELQGRAGDKSLDGALARVENRLAFGLVDDVFDLAAAYAAAISQGHCFNDGNKRTAFRAMDVLLDLHGVAIDWEIEGVGDRMVRLAQRKLDEGELADWLRTVATD